MADRSRDWFRQAERDLLQAEISKSKEIHEWACFAAQQSAEKAVKAPVEEWDERIEQGDRFAVEMQNVVWI